MTPELQKEFDELNKYKDFVYLFWNYINEINYDETNRIMTIEFCNTVTFTRTIKIYVDKEKADEMYEIFELMEQENGVEQDEVE